MKRRGFFGLLGRLIAVGAAMSVHPALLAPLEDLGVGRVLTDEDAIREIEAMNAWIKDHPYGEWQLAS